MNKLKKDKFSKLHAAYCSSLDDYASQYVRHESATRSAFQNLLAELARSRKWLLIPELAKAGMVRVVPDGTVRDENSLPRGYWEAKDTDDELEQEIKKKIKKGYPTSNIIFEDTVSAILYQDGTRVSDANVRDASSLSDLLKMFFDYSEPQYETFEAAVGEFGLRVPELAKGLASKISDAHSTNPKFERAYVDFYDLCCRSIDPEISRSLVDEMLVQHLLTERLVRTIFEKPEFISQNIIAVEIEKVINALASKSFSRTVFLRSLDKFYLAIEGAAESLPNFSDKQGFLNTVYERFFQGFSPREADTHGIVYTPQPIVDFMCDSVVYLSKKLLGMELADQRISFVDPCTGTGNFVVNILRRLPLDDLEEFYTNRLFANEIMLLPYYIASLNIEHEYFSLTRSYRELTVYVLSTLDIAAHRQKGFHFVNQANTERVDRQKSAPITVVMGNPPYNASQKK